VLDRAFVAICFLVTLFFAPLAGMVPAYASSAALLYVACAMARGSAKMDWDDITETAPAVVAAVTLPPLSTRCPTPAGKADMRQNGSSKREYQTLRSVFTFLSHQHIIAPITTTYKTISFIAFSLKLKW
jgi:hypothetical protein